MNKSLLETSDLTDVQRAFVLRFMPTSNSKAYAGYSLLLVLAALLGSAGLIAQSFSPGRVPPYAMNVSIFSAVVYAVLSFVVLIVLWAACLVVAIGCAAIDGDKEKGWIMAKAGLSFFKREPFQRALVGSLSRSACFLLIGALAISGHLFWAIVLLSCYVGARVGIAFLRTSALSAIKLVKELPPEGWSPKSE